MNYSSLSNYVRINTVDIQNILKDTQNVRVGNVARVVCQTQTNSFNFEVNT